MSHSSRIRKFLPAGIRSSRRSHGTHRRPGLPYASRPLLESLEMRQLLNADPVPAFTRTKDVMIWSLSVPHDQAAEIRSNPQTYSIWINALRERQSGSVWVYQVVENRSRPVPAGLLEPVDEIESPTEPQVEPVPQDLPNEVGILVSGTLAPTDQKDVYRVFVDPTALGIRVDVIPRGTAPGGSTPRVTMSIPTAPAPMPSTPAPPPLTAGSGVIAWRPTGSTVTEILLTVERDRPATPTTPAGEMATPPVKPKPTPTPLPAADSTQPTEFSTSVDAQPLVENAAPPDPDSAIDFTDSELPTESPEPGSDEPGTLDPITGETYAADLTAADDPAHGEYAMEYEIIITQFLPMLPPAEPAPLPVVSTPQNRPESTPSSGSSQRSSAPRDVLSLAPDSGRIAISPPATRGVQLVRSDQQPGRSSLPTTPRPVAQPLLHHGRERAVVDLNLLEGEITPQPGSQPPSGHTEATQKIDPGATPAQAINKQAPRDRSASGLPLLAAELPRLGFRSIRSQNETQNDQLEPEQNDDLPPDADVTTRDQLQAESLDTTPLPQTDPASNLPLATDATSPVNWPLTLGASVVSMLAIGLLWPELASLRWGNRRRHDRRARGASNQGHQGLLSWLRSLSSRNSASPRVPG